MSTVIISAVLVEVVSFLVCMWNFVGQLWFKFYYNYSNDHKNISCKKRFLNIRQFLFTGDPYLYYVYKKVGRVDTKCRIKKIHFATC